MTAPLVPRKRASKPKVRTGCDTCKKRRVKCDERKPRCLRCERLHHDCRYAKQQTMASSHGSRFKVPPDSNRDLAPFPGDGGGGSSSSSLAGRLFGGSSRFFYQPRCYTLSEREAPYFDAYRQRIAQRLGYTELWYRSVLRESARDPVIRHCVIALGALSHVALDDVAARRRTAADPAHHHHQPPAAGLLLPPMDADSQRHYDQACTHYGEALAQFRDRVRREGRAVPARTVLLTSLLFLALEQMQGNTGGVQQLAGNVVAMLQGDLVTFRAGGAAGGRGGAESRIAQAVDDDGVAEAELVLPRIFVTNLRACHVDPYLRRVALRLRLDPAEVEVPDAAATRLEIKRAWDRAVMRTTLYTERCRAAVRDPATPPAALADFRRGRDVLLQRLHRWGVFARALMATAPPCTPEGRIRPILLNVILASLAMCHVHTLSCLDDPDATDDDGGDAYWDRYHDYFRRSVEHAEEVIDALDWPMHDSTLSPVIHCVLQLSRDPDLRRRATALFKRLIANDRSVVGSTGKKTPTPTPPGSPPLLLQTTSSSSSSSPPFVPADRASSEESDDGGGPDTPSSTASSSCATLFSVSGTSEEGGYGAVPRAGAVDTAAAAAAAYRDGKGAQHQPHPHPHRRLCMGRLCLKTAIMNGTIVLR